MSKRHPSLRAAACAAITAVSFLIPASGAQAQLKSLVVLAQPLPLWDSVWVADAKGYYKDEGLNVEFRMFPSGTTSLQTFRAGEGEINFGGDLPGVQYWLNNDGDYRVVAVLERDSKGYLVTARKDIKTPQDLKGKTIATRVGSTGSWFISEFLTKNGLTAGDVTIKNLDTQVMPTALCHGDIDAFFIFQPFGQRAIEICPNDVHNLSTAEGYIRGYAVAAARPGWLDDPENQDKLARFLRATLKGARDAAADLPTVQKIMKERFGLSEEATQSQWEINERVIGIDDTFYADYCSLAAWMEKESLLTSPLDFKSFADGRAIASVDPARFDEAPAACN